MAKRYTLVLGIALLVAVAAGYFFNKNQYFHITSQEEIPFEVYRTLESTQDWRVEWHFNYEAGFTAALATIGFGLVLIGAFSSKRKGSLKQKSFVSH